MTDEEDRRSRYEHKLKFLDFSSFFWAVHASFRISGPASGFFVILIGRRRKAALLTFDHEINTNPLIELPVSMHAC